MKILHTIPGFGVKSGGTSTCTYDLISAMRRSGAEVDLLTVKSSDASDTLIGAGAGWIKELPNDYITPFAYSRNFSRALSGSDHDIYHTNGLWMYVHHATCAAARKMSKPLVITPHGMLYPQALARSAWKKKLMLSLCFRKDIGRTDLIHATCMPEYEHIRNLGLRNPVAVIPNPVPLPPFLDEIVPDKSAKRIGFLGRLHPRKHVHSLIEAWKKLNRDQAQLVVMGSGDADYEMRLKALADGMTDVTFTGFVSGREKFEKLASLTALVVPSDFENFGMIVTEALSVGTPVIASKGTPWQSLEQGRCGWWVDNDVDSLAEAIAGVLSMPQSELDEMGSRGKRLVEENYLDSKVAGQMVTAYRYLTGSGSKPDFILD